MRRGYWISSPHPSTARLALDEGREVFAIPGRVDSAKSSGTHRLLQEGAKLVQGVDDILEELALRPAVEVPVVPAAETAGPDVTGDRKRVVGVLDSYPKHIDQIIEETGLPAQKVSELLLLLELEGVVASAPGQYYMVSD